MTRLPSFALAALGASALAAASAGLAQRQPPSPEQRIERLERQIQQMQRQVFPKGRPADTAGFADDPAATQSSVITLAQRLDSLERQMADLLRLSEENGNALRSLQSDLAKLRSDSEARMAELEQRIAQSVVVATPPLDAPPVAENPPRPRPAPARPLASTPGSAPAGTVAVDPAEDAYTIGFKQWEAGDYDAAIRSLRSFTSAYPAHRRVSYANNLIGRSLLDKGEARAATDVLLANYRRNPKGDRAPDSLYYMGQALMKLGQAGQACKAYAELEAVYGAKMRAELRKLTTEAKLEANC